MADENSRSVDEALAQIRLMQSRGDETKGLRTAIAMVTEARDMLFAARAHLGSAKPHTIFALGELSGQIESVKAALLRDIEGIKSQDNLLTMLREQLEKHKA